MQRPNIVYLHSHDTGRYIEPYGHRLPTPRLQQLADQGVLFRRAFSAAPTCSPSRAALLTGSYPHENGMIGLTHRGFDLHDHSEHLATLLGRAGYRTGLAGLQHVSRDVEKLGFDQVARPESHRVEHVAPAAVQLIESAGPEPFFLDVGFFETHRPFPEPQPGSGDRLAPPAPLPDAPQTRQDMAGFAASAQTLDDGVGAVLDALQRAGVADRTLVICTTDHGIAFPQMKCNLLDHGIGVMLIMRGPQGFTGGRTLDAMVSQLDLLPTICELAGIEAPDRLRGRSLLPLVRDETEVLHEAIFAESTYHVAYEPQRCIRTERWKYIRRFDDRDHRVTQNCDDGLSKQLWDDHGWVDQPRRQEMLFDLVFDPTESNNLAADPRVADVLEDLRGRLDGWMRDTADPLLRGPVPAPAGARVSNPEDEL